MIDSGYTGENFANENKKIICTKAEVAKIKYESKNPCL